jgi:cytochrome c oxidase assembly factor CtaG
MSSALPIVVTLTLMAVALVYLRSWFWLRKTLDDRLSVWRLAAFMGGLAMLWVAVGSPLAFLDHDLLTAHMVQHLLLMTVAAPMILLGEAPQVFLLGFVARMPKPGPVFCWLASTVTVIGWHIPALLELGLHSEGWHAAEHACFFAAGLLFWWPVVRPWPSPASSHPWSVPLYLFLATLPCDALSAFLTFCNRVVYPHYLSVDRHFGISALADQEWAGSLMWVWVTFVYLVPAIVVTIRMLSPQKLAARAAEVV